MAAHLCSTNRLSFFVAQKGLKLVAAKMTTATKELLTEHYAELTEKK